MVDQSQPQSLRPPSMAASESTTIVNSIEPPPASQTEKQPLDSALPVRVPSVDAPPAEKDNTHLAVETSAANDKRLSQISASADEEDDFEYPTAWKLAAITTALCLSVFCMALDNTIIATAIPRITDQFKALNDVGWYGSAYLLTTCACQLIFGKFYTFYSIKWVYLIAMFIFEVGSLICGVAPNSVTLIVGRAIAGVGSAGIFAGAVLIIANTVPLRQRPTYMGIIGGMYGIASVAGPLLGGVFTDKLTWRWCFYINLPFGAVTAAFIIPFFKVSRRGEKSDLTLMQQVKKFDLEGSSLFLPGIVCLLLALQWGGSKYNWGNARIIVLFILFGILIIGFVAVQIWKQENATVPPRVFKNRNVWGAAVFAAFLGAAFFIMVYFLPIWFQAIKSATATRSGIMNLPVILGLVVISMIGGAIVSVVGYYTPFMLLSSVLMTIGAGLLSTFETDTNSPKWIGYQFLFGAGVGFGMQQPLIAVQSALPKYDVPIGTAIIMFSQTLGGALFISVGQNIFTNQLITNLKSVVPDLDPSIVLRVGATELANAIPKQFLDGVVIAYNKALTEVFYVTVAAAALSIIGAAFVEWKSVKGQKIEMAAA